MHIQSHNPTSYPALAPIEPTTAADHNAFQQAEIAHLFKPTEAVANNNINVLLLNRIVNGVELTELQRATGAILNFSQIERQNSRTLRNLRALELVA